MCPSFQFAIQLYMLNGHIFSTTANPTATYSLTVNPNHERNTQPCSTSPLYTPGIKHKLSLNTRLDLPVATENAEKLNMKHHCGTFVKFVIYTFMVVDQAFYTISDLFACFLPVF